VDADHETPHKPISSSKLNNLHRVCDFQGAQNEEERMTKVLQCQLPPKELNPRNFTLPCTIGNLNFYGMVDLGASVNVMPRNIFEYLRLANLRNTNMLVEMADMTKKAPSGINNDRVSYDMEKKDHNFTTPTENIFMIKYDLDNRPQSPTCSDNQSRNLPDRSPDDSLHNQDSKNKKIKLDQHSPRAHFCKPIKQTVNKKTKMWPTCDPIKRMCDGGMKSIGSGIVKNPLSRSFYDYKWVFDLEIDQLADEYELGIGKKGHMLDKIWE
ncbi:mutator type transposase, partial [Tanacetum coccineum]